VATASDIEAIVDRFDAATRAAIDSLPAN
jgi:hypothetical protein